MTTPPEFYPMPAFPTLSVRDLEASSRWYQEALGFQHVFTMPGPGGRPGLVHLRWARYADLLLRAAAAPPGGPAGLGITLTFAVTDGTVDAIAERACAAGAVFVQEPGDRPWNARDFTLADPDGFRLTFTKGPLDPNLTIGAVAGRAAKA
ncbi:MAG TPA: VOC family protein [Rhizomicrobium sp.]|nr:VOC family protein [Rhizomicrobium sp.]